MSYWLDIIKSKFILKLILLKLCEDEMWYIYITYICTVHVTPYIGQVIQVELKGRGMSSIWYIEHVIILLYIKLLQNNTTTYIKMM